MSLAVVLADPDGVIRYFSAGVEALFGYPAADAVGQSLDLIVPEQYRQAHWTAFHRAMATGEFHLDGATTNLPVRCADGQVRPFPARFVILTDARDQVVGAMGVYGQAAGGEQPFGPIQPLGPVAP